jgi:hypothetical protein
MRRNIGRNDKQSDEEDGCFGKPNNHPQGLRKPIARDKCPVILSLQESGADPLQVVL